MANPNYTPSYRQYTQQSAGYVLPSSVKTYSVFDPNSNSWKRMTNNGMSPMPMTPEQEQANIQAALRYAQSSQGKVWNDQYAQGQIPAVAQASAQPVIAVRQGYPRAVSKSSPTTLSGKEQNKTVVLHAEPLQASVNISSPFEPLEQTVKQSVKQAGYIPAVTLKEINDINATELGQAIPMQEHQIGQFQKLNGGIAPYSFGGNAAKPDPELTAKTLGAMGLAIGTGGAAALGYGPLALLGTVGRGASSVGGRILGSAGTIGGKLGNSAIQRGKGLIDWAKTKATRTKPYPDWQTPL